MYSNFSQFGLYRYENGASRNVLKQQRSFHSKIILCSIMAMTLIFFSLLYILVHSRNVQPEKIMETSEFKPKLPIKELDGGIEVIEIFAKNDSDVSKRIKRLDSDESDRSPDSQKLIFFPSRKLKPPKVLEKPRVINFAPVPPNHRMSSRMSEPRPFKHMMASGSKPNGFEVQSTARSYNQQVNNINDVVHQNQFPEMQNQFSGTHNQFSGMKNQFSGNQGQFSSNQGQFHGLNNQFPAQQQFHPQQNQQLTHLHQIPGHPNQFQMNQNQFPFQNNPLKKKKKQRFPPQMIASESSSMHPIQLAGTYRHPRKEKDFTKMLQSETHQNHHELQPDPFHNFKPNSAFDINQMVTGERLPSNSPTQNSPYFRRQFKHQIASIPNYKINSKDVTGIYQNVLNSGKKFQVDRNEMSKAKPIQLMLDVYPANGEELDMQQVPQMTQQMPQMTQQMSSMMQSMMQQQYPRLKPFQGYYQDPSYFNSMTFPQLMPRYPSYYRYPKLQAQSSNISPMSVTKPSQLVVHLNLYPKDKTSFKRSSTEDEIDMAKKKRQEAQKDEPMANATSVPFNINFNVNTGNGNGRYEHSNGHPENINHHVNLLKDPYHNKDALSDSTFRPSYYYDDNEENDQSIMVAPSLIYHNIQRDRPIHLMLKNATTTENPTKKTNNHKHTYQTIERPRKQQRIRNEPRSVVD